MSAHADEAVAVFFVMSGIVIRFVSVEKEMTLRSYALARFTRIYSVVPLALLVTYICDQIAVFGSSSPSGQHLLTPNHTLSDLLRCLTFSNQYWFQDIQFGSNHPYWSLGFEVNYYIIFALFAFISNKIFSIMIITAFLFVLGPKISCYFLIWILGVVFYRNITNGFKMKRSHALFLFVSSIVLYSILRNTLSYLKHPMFEYTDLYNLIYSLTYYLVIALIFIMNLVAFQSLAAGEKVFTASQTRAIRWLANGSFTVYLAHVPLLNLANSVIPNLKDNSFIGALVLASVIALCLGLAEIGERRKHLLKPRFAQMLNATWSVVHRKA